MKKLITIILLNLFCCNIVLSETLTYEWFKTQTKHKTSNSLVWEDDFENFLKKNISSKKIYLGMNKGGEKIPLWESYREVLAGPPNLIVYKDNRKYFFTSACRHQSCTEKGVLFIDTKKKYTIGLIRHSLLNDTKFTSDPDFLIFSKNLKSFDEIPTIFIELVKEWIATSQMNKPPSKVRFIGSDDKLIDITNEYSKKTKLYCSHIKQIGEFGDIQIFNLNSKSFNNLEMSNSLIKFSFDTSKYFVSSVFNKDKKLLINYIYKDSERKILEFSQSWHCEDELDKIQKFVKTSEKEEQTPKDKRTVTESKIDVAWNIGDKFIIPECFDYVWMSGDRYETFFDEYIEKLDAQHWDDPRVQKFIINIGTYLNKEVPLNHSIKTGWEEFPNGISLSKQLDSCMSDKPETEVMFETEYGSQSEIRYEVVETYSLEKGKELAPHIKQEFESIKKVKITEWGGGSMGHQKHTVTYGLLTIEGKKVLLPLKNHIKY